MLICLSFSLEYTYIHSHWIKIKKHALDSYSTGVFGSACKIAQTPSHALSQGCHPHHLHPPNNGQRLEEFSFGEPTAELLMNLMGQALKCHSMPDHGPEHCYPNLYLHKPCIWNQHNETIFIKRINNTNPNIVIIFSTAWDI